MELSLKNIGKITEAKIKIDGITVIAGENDTGKSTISKSLYSVFNSLNDIDNKIKEERTKSIARVLRSTIFETKHEDYISYKYFYPKALNIVEYSKKNEHSRDEVIDYLKNISLEIDDEKLLLGSSEIEQIYNILNLDDVEILGMYIERTLRIEFSRQINNAYSKEPGSISLKIKDNLININVENNSVTKVENPISLRNEAIYIDDPNVLDLVEAQEVVFRPYNVFNMYHRKDLKLKLLNDKVKNNVVEELLAKRQIEEIYQKINSVCDGDIVKNEDFIGYKKKNSNVILNFTNLSTGLKSFSIIKQLLEKGYINQNGTLILDEPEVHLHPEWQIIFAELIILLHKDFGLHILLNTHSPYFLNAIETYAQKHEVTDKCNYYSAVSTDEGSFIKDVTENTEVIYSKLARPLQELENLRYRYSDD